MPPEPTAAPASPAPTDPLQALGAHLENVMAEAEIAANAQRDQEAEASTPPVAAPRQEAAPAAPVEEGSDESEDEEPSPAGEPDEADDDDEEAEEEEEEDEQPARAPAPTAEQPKYSRRDAARFAAELESTKTTLASTKKELERHQGELNHFRESDQAIRRHLQQQSGFVQEQNGRFRYENLSEKVLKGTATPEEAEEVAQMTQWHEFAGPIYRAAEASVLGSFAADWAALKDLPGIGEQGMTELNKAQKTIDGVRTVHKLAYAAGEAAAKQKYEAKLAKLTADNKSLRTQKVATAPQPASANGAAVPGNPGIIARMLDPKTGQLNPEFEREVAAGKWLGVDLSAQ